MRRRIRRPSPALVVALIALFVALGGTGYAAATGSIDGREIKNSTIQSKDIKNSSVTGTDVKNNSLTGSDVQESKLGEVPSATSADRAGSAGSASTASTAGTAGTAGRLFQATKSSDTALPTAGGAQSTILTLNVPAGSYLILGKGTGDNNTSGAFARRNCLTTAGGDSDNQFVGMGDNAVNDDVTPWTNSLVHTFAAGGTVTLSCEAGPQTVLVHDAKIQAYQVAAASSTATP